MELGGHCGYGFRHVPESKNLNFFFCCCLLVLTVWDSKTPPAVLKIASASSNQPVMEELQPCLCRWIAKHLLHMILGVNVPP